MEAIYRGKRYNLREVFGVERSTACNLVTVSGFEMGQWMPRKNWTKSMFPVDDAGPVKVSEKGLTVRAYISCYDNEYFAVGHDCEHNFFHRAFVFEKWQ